MIGRAVVTESGNEFLGANSFVFQIFECDDIIFPKGLKFSFLRERRSKGEQSGYNIPLNCTTSCNSRGKA